MAQFGGLEGRTQLENFGSEHTENICAGERETSESSAGIA